MGFRDGGRCRRRLVVFLLFMVVAVVVGFFVAFVVVELVVELVVAFIDEIRLCGRWGRVFAGQGSGIVGAREARWAERRS